jgi:hypothetical protein
MVEKTTEAGSRLITFHMRERERERDPMTYFL